MPVPTNPQFPTFTALPGIAIPIIRSPIWNTISQTSIAGVDAPNEPWTYPRYRYKLSYQFLRQAAAYGELQTLMGFFNTVGGKYGVFMYDDPQDDTTIADQSFGTGDLVTTTFQLVRTRGTFVEPVFAVNAITNLKVNGVPKTGGGVDYSVSNKGVITFNAAPAAAATLTWTGTYLWFCRFDNDQLDFTQFTAAADRQGPLWSATDVTFTTIKFGS